MAEEDGYDGESDQPDPGDEQPTEPGERHEIFVWHNGRVVYRHTSDVPLTVFTDQAVPLDTDPPTA